MGTTNLKKEISGDLNEVIERLTKALGLEGFGILTRIDLQSKIQEKLGKKIEPVVILGACHPELAYEAYKANTDVAGLLPCNAVVRQLSPGRVSVELTKPSFLMEMLNDKSLTKLASDADEKLKHALQSLDSKEGLRSPDSYDAHS